MYDSLIFRDVWISVENLISFNPVFQERQNINSPHHKEKNVLLENIKIKIL
jgi:hypothetical protein